MSQDREPVSVEAQADDEYRIGVTRRRFLKGVGAAIGLVAIGVIPAFAQELAMPSGRPAGAEGSAEAENPLAHFIEEDVSVNYPGEPVWYAPPVGKQKWAMVIDVHACVGCRKCVYACVKENNIGRNSGFTYIQVLENELGTMELENATLDYEEGGSPNNWYQPVQCMHCAKPTCVYGCPVKATWKEPDGIVVVDYDKCISCRNCIVTCPYSARHNNWVEPHVPENEINPKVPLEKKGGVIEKCTFCVQRVRNGQTTACTEACPVGARTFGDLNDPESAVAKLIKTRRVFRMKEELGNEPMIWYVG